jgi:hypothetical protein
MSESIEEVRLRRIGNGRGILISKSICNLVGLRFDDRMRVDIERGCIILTPIKGGGGQ